MVDWEPLIPCPAQPRGPHILSISRLFTNTGFGYLYSATRKSFLINHLRAHFEIVETAEILQELESLATSLAVEIRYDDLETRGGLCRYGAHSLLVVNERLTPSERVELLVETLASLPFDTVFVRPQVRDMLEGSASSIRSDH